MQDRINLIVNFVNTLDGLGGKFAMTIIHLILPLVLLIPGGVYLYFYFLRTADFWGLKRKKIVAKIVAVFITLCAIVWSVNLFGVGALIVLHLGSVALCMEVINFIFVALHKHRDMNITVWNRLFSCGLLPVIIATLILGYGYFNMENVVERDYTIHTKKMIRPQGYKIALISDLHFGITMDEKKLDKYSRDIEGKKPDLVVLCGDIFDNHTTLTEMKNAARILGNIKSKYGTFYVYGNHDKSSYGSRRNFSADQLKSELTTNGINVLEDQIYHVNNEFTIIGRKDRGFSADKKRETSVELLKNVDTKDFLLLLDHQPSELMENSKAGMDLQLSGHTHGGQIWPIGLISDILGFGQLNYGYEKINKYQIIVTSGIGGYGYPIRTGKHSEYDIIDVKR